MWTVGNLVILLSIVIAWCVFGATATLAWIQAAQAAQSERRYLPVPAANQHRRRENATRAIHHS